MIVCAVEGCGKPVDRRGWCTSHYFHWYRYGDPTTVIPRGAHKVFCKRGHDMTDSYIRRDTGIRQCRQCIRLRARARKDDRQVRIKVRIKGPLRRRIYALSDGCCAYCGAPNATTVDHIIPKADRRRADIRDDDERYLVAACMRCNLNKSTRRLVPMLWEVLIPALAELIPGTPWRVWDGSTDSPAYREVHL